MSTHNICFCGKIRKISVFFDRKKRKKNTSEAMYILEYNTHV